VCKCDFWVGGRSSSQFCFGFGEVWGGVCLKDGFDVVFVWFMGRCGLLCDDGGGDGVFCHDNVVSAIEVCFGVARGAFYGAVGYGCCETLDVFSGCFVGVEFVDVCGSARDRGNAAVDGRCAGVTVFDGVFFCGAFDGKAGGQGRVVDAGGAGDAQLDCGAVADECGPGDTDAPEICVSLCCDGEDDPFWGPSGAKEPHVVMCAAFFFGRWYGMWEREHGPVIYF